MWRAARVHFQLSNCGRIYQLLTISQYAIDVSLNPNAPATQAVRSTMKAKWSQMIFQRGKHKGLQDVFEKICPECQTDMAEQTG